MSLNPFFQTSFVSFLSVPYSFSEILNHIYYNFSNFFFRKFAYLHLVVFVFVLNDVPLSGTYFSTISFFLTFCVCGLLFAGCRVVTPVSGVCSLVGVFGPGACAGFLMVEIGACQLVDGAVYCPSGG